MGEDVRIRKCIGILQWSGSYIAKKRGIQW